MADVSSSGDSSDALSALASRAGVDPLVAQIVSRQTPGDSTMATRAAAILEKQAKLIDHQIALAGLQVEDLKREDSVRHWSLRIHHISELMKLTFELALAFIFLAIAFAIGAALWSAAHEDGLVIEAFAVPPDMAARGLTGQIVAAQFQDKLVAMQRATVSARPAESYSSNWGNDIKVEIPNTGISIGELYRYLAGWLGNETHVTGEVFRNANGLSVTVRAGDGASTVTGQETELDKLLQQVAENVYLRTQPYRYAIFIQQLGPARLAESRKILEDLAANGPVRERAWALNGLGVADAVGGHTEASIRDYRQVLALSPNFALAYVNLDFYEGLLGHDEASLDAAENAVRLMQAGGDVEMSDTARNASFPSERADVAFGQNDFHAAVADEKETVLLPDFNGTIENGRDAIIIADALLHDETAVRRAFAALPPKTDMGTLSNRANTLFVADYWLGHWPQVLRERPNLEVMLSKMLAAMGASPSWIARTKTISISPYVATAMAMAGDIAGARALIATTPLDCYSCVRSRAHIAEAAHNWDEAGRWYALATREAPSIPVGYSEWGRMLLMKGDVESAIAKFTEAHQKGPHFGDPLEFWGEALMQENRSDLALAKFEEANKYAPRWGRLHLKWGEALWWSGDRRAATHQFAIASGLDLSSAEREALGRASRRH